LKKLSNAPKNASANITLSNFNRINQKMEINSSPNIIKANKCIIITPDSHLTSIDDPIMSKFFISKGNAVTQPNINRIEKIQKLNENLLKVINSDRYNR